MRRQVSIVLRSALAVLVFSGYLALASVRLYGLGLLLIPLLVLPLAPVGSYLEKKVYAWRVLRWALAVAYIGFLPFSLQLFGLMDAVILLVIFIQVYLLLGEKNARVFVEIYLMAFFLLLAAVSQSPESLIAIGLFLFAISTVWVFTALRMFIELTENPARSYPELVPIRKASGSRKTGNIFDFGLIASMTVLSICSLALSVVLFIFTPRVEAGWLGRRDSQQSVTGISETVRLMGATNIAEDTSIVMHVQFPDEEDGRFSPETALYWRITTLPRFSADEWSRRGLQEHYEPKVPGELGINERLRQRMGLPETRRLQREDARNVRQIIYMDRVPEQGLPCLDLPRSVRVIGDSPYSRVSWDSAEDFTLVFESRGARSLQYECVSTITEHPPESLREAPLEYAYMAPRDYSLLTYQELLPETQALARRITDDRIAPYEKVKALETWLGGPEFTYTLTVPPLPEQHGIDAFITDIKTGHCELYASALALMTRSLGIPARVVSGYRGGEYSAPDSAYLVRGAMAHLWVEALFKDIGWVRFDPSPRSDMTPTGLGRIRMTWSSYVLRAKMFWFQQVEGFGGRIQLEDLMRFRPWQWRPPHGFIPDIPGGEETDPSQKAFSYWSLLEHRAFRVAAAFMGLAGLIFLWRRWRNRAKPQHALTGDQVRMRKLYFRFLKKAASLGVDCVNKSATEIWGALKNIPLEDYGAAQAFIQTYHSVRFGGRPLDKPLYEQALKQVHALRREKSRT